MFRVTHFVLQKSTKPQSRQFGVRAIAEATGCLDYSKLIHFVAKVVKAECYGKKAEKCKVFSYLMDKEIEKLDQQVCL